MDSVTHQSNEEQNQANAFHKRGFDYFVFFQTTDIEGYIITVLILFYTSASSLRHGKTKSLSWKRKRRANQRQVEIELPL